MMQQSTRERREHRATDEEANNIETVAPHEMG
jgi:hypothetical protein